MLLLDSTDITKIKCDVIVNSLGVDTTVYGRLCENIIKAANSKELENEVKSFKKDATPGKLFITKGYNLPSANIIHIVVPFYKYDKDLYALEWTYKCALVLANKKGWKYIALPIIGTGANGYPHALVQEMVTNLSLAFMNAYPEMKVTISVPVTSKQDYYQKFNDKEIKDSIEKFLKKYNISKMRNFEYDSNSFKMLGYFDKDDLLHWTTKDLETDLFIEEKRRMSFAKQNFIDIDTDPKSAESILERNNDYTYFEFDEINHHSITDYVDKYLEKRIKDDKERSIVAKYMGKFVGGYEWNSLKSKHSKTESTNKVPLRTLMRYILVLHMRESEAKRFLEYCSKSFSPINPEDRYYLGLLRSSNRSVYWINSYCTKVGIPPIFNPEAIDIEKDILNTKSI